MSDRIAIVGGGFSGAMLAARLAEAGVASTLIDRTGGFGLGVAYGAAEPWHRLNVRSARMSALADRPDDFVDWLKIHAPGEADPLGFAPRPLYGRYVQDRLAGVQTARPGLIDTVVGAVTELAADAAILADGRRIGARALVLATGNPPPRTAEPAHPGVIADPWRPGALDEVRPSDQVLLLGSGLTMIDVALSLEARGWLGRATALSRRGVSPRRHGPQPDPAAPTDPRLAAGPLSRRLAVARDLAEAAGWRPIMEALRPTAAELWRDLPGPERRRALRHLRPWWDVHRHRLAPQVHDPVQALIDADRLEVVAGRLISVQPGHGVLSVTWRARGQAAARTLTADRLIDCTGPGHDPARDRLTAPLLAAGEARLDASGLGLDLDGEGRLIGADGRPRPRLFALGPPACGAYWETIAVPDIRLRIERMVQVLSEARP